MSRSASRIFIALVAIASLATSANANAQFGGLIKKKLAQTAINKAAPQPVVAADTQAQRRDAAEMDRKARRDAWDHPTVITTANLGNFMTAIHAEQGERAKAAATPDSPLGKSVKYSTENIQCKRDMAGSDFNHSGQRIAVE